MYLGLDLGSSALQALFINDDQRIVGSASAELDVLRPAPGWSEQKAQDWIEACEKALEALKTDHGQARAAVDGIDFGAARLGLIAATSGDPTAVCAAPVVARSFEPEADLRDAVDDTYSHYHALYPAVSGAMT